MGLPQFFSLCCMEGVGRHLGSRTKGLGCTTGLVGDLAPSKF